MRVIIIGDSLIYESDEVDAGEDAYGYILRKFFKSIDKNNDVFIIIPKLGNITNDTKYQSHPLRLNYDVKQFEPDIVIVHLGIVDCAPRLFTELENDLIDSLPFFIKNKIIKFFSKRRFFFTKKYQKTYIEIHDFQKNYQKILTEIKKIDAIPIIINIAKPNQRLLDRSYNFLENVKRYNNVLFNLSKKNQCKLIDVYSLVENEPDLRWDDGIHLKKEGHKRLANILIQEIQSIVKIE